jgi:hypothetical protein
MKTASRKISEWKKLTSYYAWSPTLKMDVIFSSETSVDFYHTLAFSKEGIAPSSVWKSKPMKKRPSLWSSGQSSWLHNGDVLFLWGTNWIYICYVEENRPPLWSSGRSSWLQIQRFGIRFPALPDPRFLDLGTSCGLVVSYTPLSLCPPPPPTGYDPLYPLKRRLGGHQNRSERYGEMKILDLNGTRTPTPLSSIS